MPSSRILEGSYNQLTAKEQGADGYIKHDLRMAISCMVSTPYLSQLHVNHMYFPVWADNW